jgi:dihydrofolate reductase
MIKPAFLNCRKTFIQMPNIVYIAASIDGYIAREDGNIDWLTEIPDDSDYGFFDFMKRIDGMIMGRKTFETVQAFDKWFYTKPVFVISNSLDTITGKFAEKVELVRGDLHQILESLKRRGINTLYIDGGKTIHSFLQQDLIDEMIITRIPILLGKGIPLFAKSDHELRFAHSSTETYNNGLVKSHYLRKR